MSEEPADRPEAVLSALANDDCRTILSATADESMTVWELSTMCDIPAATVYRKVEWLAELSLLDEHIRIKPRGRNSREYRLCAESVQILIREQNSPVVRLESESESDLDRGQLIVSTDGGKPNEESDATAQQRRLQEIFEDVTGTVQFVETEEQTVGSRYVESEHEMTVSEYVAVAAREDGLSDAITTPDIDSDLD